MHRSRLALIELGDVLWILPRPCECVCDDSSECTAWLPSNLSLRIFGNFRLRYALGFKLSGTVVLSMALDAISRRMVRFLFDNFGGAKSKELNEWNWTDGRVVAGGGGGGTGLVFLLASLHCVHHCEPHCSRQIPCLLWSVCEMNFLYLPYASQTPHHLRCGGAIHAYPGSRESGLHEQL